jgi:sulfate/thiosulfate transport system substrate-binding protein
VENQLKTRLTMLALAAAALLALLAAAGCGGQQGSDKLTLVAYSTPKDAYSEIIPAFKETTAGSGTSFDESYAASGAQERAVEGGLLADVVALSLEPDMTKLEKAGFLVSNWNKGRYHGLVTDSVVVFMTRKGNPKKIRNWDDLVKPGVDVISPNPFTSGGGKWNISAAYGAQIEKGRSQQQALDYVSKLFKNVSVLDKSARNALQTFTSGKGDVLIAYENEAITAQQKGEKVDFVRPDQTILVENPAAVATKTTREGKRAKAFVDFLTTDRAQKIFAAKGYRPVVKKLVDKKKFPDPSGLFDIGKLGGWPKVNDELFDPDKGKVADIFQKQGKATGGG